VWKDLKAPLLASLITAAIFSALAYAATTTLTLGVNGSEGGAIVLNGATSGSATIGVPAAAGTTTANLPVGNGPGGVQLINTDGAGNWGYAGPNKFASLSWASGMNLGGSSIPLVRVAAASTITGVFCVPETLVGGVATLQVFFAASGTLLASGTKINTTDCNANTGVLAEQNMGATTTAVPANSWIGVVVPAGAGWAASVGSGSVSISLTQP
jgi:hypothetical protein